MNRMQREVIKSKRDHVKRMNAIVKACNAVIEPDRSMDMSDAWNGIPAIRDAIGIAKSEIKEAEADIEDVINGIDI